MIKINHKNLIINHKEELTKMTMLILNGVNSGKNSRAITDRGFILEPLLERGLSIVI